MHKTLNTKNGFTLIELLIAVTVIAILTAIAIPFYNNYMLKTHRSDAVTSLNTLALNEEEYMLDQGVYTGTLADIWSSTTSSEGYYNLTLQLLDENGNITAVPADATGFEIQADPTGSQASDTDCDPMILTVNNGQISRSPSDCW
ncbi:type IV pilin protein [Facilibium subflavum]|uniref:type IV pilin protein n=1 Tax=Facilibium subflavum TaxID=2219058 RepID=UPI0013C32F26|nr:type IV pilin protein [Facilibium subflavum]